MTPMDLYPYIDTFRRQLAVIAEAGGEQAVALANRLTAPLEAATRLMLLEALSAAVGEITCELAPCSVELRLRGTEPEFVVTQPSQQELTDTKSGSPSGSVTSAATDYEEGGSSRITLRLPEPLKARLEKAADRGGLSVNAWLVRAVAASLETREAARGEWPEGGAGSSRFTGWVR